MAKTVYDIIKKQNGEGFARVLRDKNLLDIPDIVTIVKYAGRSADDATALSPYLWSLKQFEEIKDAPIGDPFQLLDSAGYHAFEVHNLDEQNSIKRFFRGNEELCTFRDTGRYQNNYMIHAVKHDVWRDPYAIKPSDKPERQDEYGTSVISIQIRKKGGFISIKNRYNHTVEYPDQTFNSNPDEIIPGLSASLKAYFNVDWQQAGILVPNGFILQGNQILKTDFEIQHTYIGDGFYVTHMGDITEIDKNNQIQIDYFIWDNREKKLLNPSYCNDCFPQIFNKFIQGKQVTITGKSPNQTILVDGTPCIQLQNRQIVSLNLQGLTQVEDAFLYANTGLTELNLPNLVTTGRSFLYHNTQINNINMPRLEQVGDYFLNNNTELTQINLPNLTQVGWHFISKNEKIHTVKLPELKYVGDAFLQNNIALRELSLPNTISIAHRFLGNNDQLNHLDLPQLESVGCNFLDYNTELQELKLPNLKEIGFEFMGSNTKLQHIDMPNLQTVGNEFLYENTELREIYLPNLTKADRKFLRSNKQLQRAILPSLQSIGWEFLQSNTELQELDLSSLKSVPDGFLPYNTKLKQLTLPLVTKLPQSFMHNNKTVVLNLPMLQQVEIEHDKFISTKPAINTPITDIFPNRRNIAQKFRAAIKNFYNNIQIRYQINNGHDL